MILIAIAELFTRFHAATAAARSDTMYAEPFEQKKIWGKY